MLSKTSALRSLLTGAALCAILAAVPARAANAVAAGVRIDAALSDALTLVANRPGLSVVRIAGESMLPYFGDNTVVVVRKIDVARVRLIHDLRRDLDIGEDAMPVVLSLLDQVYELRGTLKSLLRALQSQPPDVQAQLLSVLGPSRRSD